MTDKYIYKTGPNYLFIIFMIIGTALCAFLVNLVWSSGMTVHGTSEKTGRLIILIFIGFFVLFGLVCLFMVIGFKTFYLTQDELILKRPLLLFSQRISLKDMTAFVEKENKIDISRDVFSTRIVSIGHTSTIRISNDKKIMISSIEIWGYNTLMKKINAQIRINKDRHQ
jgi:hypothetical protein